MRNLTVTRIRCQAYFSWNFGIEIRCRTTPRLSVASGRNIPATEDEFRMEECSGHAGGDGDQVALAGENLHLTGAGEFRKVDSASTADAGGGGFVGGHRRKVR